MIIDHNTIDSINFIHFFLSLDLTFEEGTPPLIYDNFI